MKVTTDTNLLVRVVVGDDPAQTEAASRILDDAEVVAVPLPCLCEFVWVLRSVYRLPSHRVAASIRAITERANVSVDAAAVTAGLQLLDAGGDFADGAIAAAGAAMGGEIFVSFDRKAVARISTIGMSAELATTLA